MEFDRFFFVFFCNDLLLMNMCRYSKLIWALNAISGNGLWAELHTNTNPLAFCNPIQFNQVHFLQFTCAYKSVDCTPLNCLWWLLLLPQIRSIFALLSFFHPLLLFFFIFFICFDWNKSLYRKFNHFLLFSSKFVFLIANYGIRIKSNKIVCISTHKHQLLRIIATEKHFDKVMSCWMFSSSLFFILHLFHY